MKNILMLNLSWLLQHQFLTQKKKNTTHKMGFKADKPNMKQHGENKPLKMNRDPCKDSNLNVT